MKVDVLRFFGSIFRTESRSKNRWCRCTTHFLNKYGCPSIFEGIGVISSSIAFEWYPKCVNRGPGRVRNRHVVRFFELFLDKNLAASIACWISPWIFRLSTPNFNRRLGQYIPSLWYQEWVTKWGGRWKIIYQFRIFSLFDHQLDRPFNISMNIDLLGSIFHQHWQYTYSFISVHWIGVWQWWKSQEETCTIRQPVWELWVGW